MAVERLALRNVSATDTLRRGFVVGGRIWKPSVVVLAVLWLPAIAIVLAVPFVELRVAPDLLLMLLTGAITALSVATAPVLAAMVAALAIRASVSGACGFSDAGHALRQWRAAVLPGLVAGLATVLALSACVLPGLVVGAVAFVVGPASTLGKTGVTDALTRSATLTKGSRWKLGVVMFLYGFVERVLSTFAQVLWPQHHLPGAVAGDMLGVLAVSLLVGAFVTILRAATSAVAYADLVALRDGVELEQQAAQLGGAIGPDLALSDAQIDRLASEAPKQAEEPDAEAVASTRDMQALSDAKARRGRAIAIVAAVAVSLSLVAGIGSQLYARHQRAKHADAAVQRLRTAWEEWERANPAAPDSMRRFQAVKLGRSIRGWLRDVDASKRRRLLWRLMATHAFHYYGPGFEEVFAKLRDGAPEDALRAALDNDQALGHCRDAFRAARASGTGPTKVFVDGCPPDGRTVLDDSRFKANTPLSHGALALALEIRAEGRDLVDDGLHKLVLKALLKR